MAVLYTIAELDEHLRMLDAAEALTDQHMREAAAETHLAVDLATLPADPTSPEYRVWQLALYERVAERRYTVANEATTFDAESARREPFPYSTRSPRTVGDHLLSYGHLIRTLDLHAGLRVLEVGSGFGALTFHLATMAYKVTCVDISAELLAFVQSRTVDAPFPVRAVCGDMATVPLEGDDAGPYDAIIFYESFHHCLDHIGLLDRLPGLLAPGGTVVLAAEPIQPVPSPMVPYPWGLRLDGISLRAIRRHGWLELGFTAEYITELFRSRGWAIERNQLGNNVLADLWLAKRRPSADPGRAMLFDEPADSAIFGTQLGVRDGGSGSLSVRESSAGYFQFGPYFTAKPGRYVATWTGQIGGGSAARFEAVLEQGTRVIASMMVVRAPAAATEATAPIARIVFDIDRERDDVEVRIWAEPEADITLTRVKVEKVDV